MPNSSTSHNRLILFALWVIFYASFTLFLPPLLDDADSVHAEVAREMMQRHDWVTLYANGIRYLEKAPILYWSMAASFKLFGVSTAAARVPLALTVLGLCFLLEGFARRAFGSERAGLYAGLITLSSFGIFIFTRITIPDADVCLWLTLALLAFWRTEQAPASVPDPGGERRGTIRLKTKFNRASRPFLRAFTAAPKQTGDPAETDFDYETWDRTDADSYQELRSKSRARAVATAIFPDRRGRERWAAVHELTFAPLLPCLVFATACALNVLTKGLIGIVFPIATVVLYLLVTRGIKGTWKRLGELHPFASLFVFFVIAAPWHILIGLANPTQGHPGGVAFIGHHWQVPLPTDGNVHGWFWFYFVNEHILRYLNLRVPRDYDTVPLGLFWGLLLVWLMPWSAFLFHAIAQVPLRSLLKKGRAEGLTSLEKTHTLLGVWAVLPLLFFSLSTRQEYYVLPAMPALILLIAAWLGQRAATKPEAERHRRSGRRAAGVLALFGAIAACVCVYFVLHAKAPAPSTDLSALLQQNPGDYALSFGHFLDLNAQALGMFRLPLLLTAIAFGVLLPAAWVERMGNRAHSANLVTAAGAFLFLVAAHLGLQTFSPVLSSERMAAAIAPQVRPGDLIILHGEYEAGSTLGFYLRRNDLHICEGRSSNLWYGSFFPDAPKIFETRESVAKKWEGPQRIFLWQDPLDRDRPVLQMHPMYVVASSGGKQILSNQPNR